MKRTFLLITCIGALLLSACGGDSKLPTPTGDGAIRMINAIPGSPPVFFLIEERGLGDVPYQQSSQPHIYNDFDYVFNFEARYPGEAIPTRVASQALKVEKDRDHIFLLTGDINAPTITVWNGDQREWEGTETTFEVRFSHASATLGDIDVYFDEPDTVPGTNPPVATLSFTEIADPADFEQGDYEITVTAAGDPDTVHFTSYSADLLSQFAHVITIYDGDGNNAAPVVVRSMTAVGNPLPFPDSTYAPQVRFIHSAYTLETVDAYDDELLTNLVAAGLEFKGSTADSDSTTEAGSLYFTPADSQATVLFEDALSSQVPGTFRDIFLIGDTDDWSVEDVTLDRASAQLGVSLNIFHAALGYGVCDVYVKDRGEPLVEDDTPFTVIAYGFLTSTGELTEGSFDIYLTEQGTKTEVSAPHQIDVALGDVVHLYAVDTIDPAVLELVDLPLP